MKGNHDDDATTTQRTQNSLKRTIGPRRREGSCGDVSMLTTILISHAMFASHVQHRLTSPVYPVSTRASTPVDSVFWG